MVDVPHPAARAGRSRPAVLVLAASLLVACSQPAAELGPTLVRYERTWPDGLVEAQTIDTSGQVLMTHGGGDERLTLSADDLATIESALDAPIPTGSAEDSPKRRIELADGTVIEAPRLVEGSVTVLLDNLMSRHQL
jgi:hypothetical protein